MLRKNLSTEHTEGTDGWELDGIFLGSLRLEILEEIFNKNMACGQTDKGQVRVIAGTCHRGQATSLRTESLPD